MSDYKDLLINHETTHAARMVIYDKDGNIVSPDFDSLEVVTNSEQFLKQFPSTRASAGYDIGEIDENGEAVELSGENARMQFMEICTESIAGMMNDLDSQSFENFSIPTKRMGAISYMEIARNLLILAIGNDDFILDMLEENSNYGFEKVNRLLKKYNKDIDIIKYFSICYDNEMLENLTTEMFLKRMKEYQGIDKKEQVQYFKEILQNEKLKGKLENLLEGKDFISKELNCNDIQKLAKKDEVIMERENARKMVSQLERETQIEKDDYIL